MNIRIACVLALMSLAGTAFAQKASTEDDATRCVAPPQEVRNTAFPNGSAARITNNCDFVVKAKICLRIEGKWDCGASFGVKPGQSWSYSSTRKFTELFYDARNTDSVKGLAKPAP